MMRPDAKVEKVYLYPKPVDFRKSIDGLAALVELDIKVAVFDPVLFVFLKKPRAQRPVLNFTAWSRLPKPTAKSLMRGCATHWNACRRPHQLKTTKHCYRGTARRYHLAKRTTHHEAGGVYGALTEHWHPWCVVRIDSSTRYPIHSSSPE